MFVRAVIVHDQVQRRLVGELFIQAAQELQELLVPMALITLAHDLALQDLQCGKECGRAIAFVVVGHGAATPFLEREARLGSVQRLNLALLVNAQHQGSEFLISTESNAKLIVG